MATSRKTAGRQPTPTPSAPAEQSVTISAQWQGPLPPPAALERFNQIIPDGANRIMEMVEREQAHRIEHEQKVLEATVADTRRGHYLGALIAVLSIIGAAFTAYISAPAAVSVALVGLPVAVIVQAIVTRK